MSIANITYFNLPFPIDSTISLSLTNLQSLCSLNTINIFKNVNYDGDHIYSPFFYSRFQAKVTPPPNCTSCSDHCIGKTLIIFNSLIQFIAYKLALYFSDYDILSTIIKENNPFYAGSLILDINNFNLEEYISIIPNILNEGNMLKFTQNNKLLAKIINNTSQLFAYANPFDFILGTGLDIEQSKETSNLEWPGTNLLGLSLVKTKYKLQTMQNANINFVINNNLNNNFNITFNGNKNNNVNNMNNDIQNNESKKKYNTTTRYTNIVYNNT